MSADQLSFLQYGKSRVRLVRVIRDKSNGEPFKDLSVEVLLRGRSLANSYVSGDNSTTVPTDTMKNTVYALAKLHPIECIETFAVQLAQHFVTKYQHIGGCEIDIQEHLWDRMVLNGKPHDIAYTKRGPETRRTHVSLTRGQDPHITSKIVDLVVLKTSGSSFEGFPRCEYTTLPESKDRLFCTSMEITWAFNKGARGADLNAVYEGVRLIAMTEFAQKHSKSVQQTIFDIGTEVCRKYSCIESVNLKLPNIHIFHFDIDRFSLKNNDEVYQPLSDPSGFLEGTITQTKSKL